jgi:ABC-type nickel/cobalt efflux system permease component RcnA
MQGTAIATLLVGFVLGLQHATDTDHIVAVTTLASDSENPRRSALVGALWGFGHMLTLFIAGSILIVLRLRMSARAEWALELFVALVLIWLGVHTIRNCFTGRYHFHAHEHGGRRHAHLHFHAHDEAGHAHDAHAGKPARLGHRPLSVLVGMAHGLAGTGALALVVLTSIPSRLLGLIYLLVFGFGALIGMVVFSALVGLPLAGAARRLTWLNAMRFAAGAGSTLLGVVLAYRAFLPPSFPF